MERWKGREREILWTLFAVFFVALVILSFVPETPCTKEWKYWTNLYGLEAVVGAYFGISRSFAGTKNFHDCARYSPFWICCGLVVWSVGQACYMIVRGSYPSWDDLIYLGAIAVWTFLGLGATLFRFLDRDIRKDVGGQIWATALIVWATLFAGVKYVNDHYGPQLSTCPGTQVQTGLLDRTLATDQLYVILTTFAGFLAFALLLGPSAAEGSSKPRRIMARPMEGTLKLLFTGAFLHMLANFAFIVTNKKNSFLGSYMEGGWVDWLLLGAIHSWCLGVVEYPVGRGSAFYVFSTYGAGIIKSDVAQAAAMFNKYIANNSGGDRKRMNESSIQWIVQTIPECWTVATYCKQVVGSALVVPVSREMKEAFLAGRISEREMFEKTQANALSWDALYLAAAAVLPNHRGRHLALECLRRAIDSVKAHNPNVELFSWPVSDGGDHLIREVKDQFHMPISVLHEGGDSARAASGDE